MYISFENEVVLEVFLYFQVTSDSTNERHLIQLTGNLEVVDGGFAYHSLGLPYTSFMCRLRLLRQPHEHPPI